MVRGSTKANERLHISDLSDFSGELRREVKRILEMNR